MSNKTTVHKRLAGSPAELLSIEGMYEATNSGHLLGIPLSFDDEVITAYEGDEAVALVAFTEYEESGELWIEFGYCRPAYRRKGYYQDCITVLREIAKERGYNHIHTAVHPTNTAAKASIEARGGTLRYLWYGFPV